MGVLGPSGTAMLDLIQGGLSANSQSRLLIEPILIAILTGNNRQELEHQLGYCSFFLFYRIGRFSQDTRKWESAPASNISPRRRKSSKSVRAQIDVRDGNVKVRLTGASVGLAFTFSAAIDQARPTESFPLSKVHIRAALSQLQSQIQLHFYSSPTEF